jgi:ubiquitin C-terminal hydrolase
MKKLSVERCLRHFTMPETLADPVDCPSCGKKTLTKKQHVISRLPRVLVLHLKRFDAAQNKKIEDFVSFPEKALNMGPYLPHWYVSMRVMQAFMNQGWSVVLTHLRVPPLSCRCEVPRVSPGDRPVDDDAGFVPDISYNLFGTVNHYGNMQSGHYVANIKVDEQWFHCNDAHVSHNGAKEVLEEDGAYLLFYIRG